MVVVQLVDVLVVYVLLLPHGVLVHGSVGLRGGVVGRWDAVTGLTAVVAVAVVHGAVRILVCSQEERRRDRMVSSESWRRRPKNKPVVDLPSYSPNVCASSPNTTEINALH